MKKIVLLLLSAFLITIGSCSDAQKRQKYLQTIYPYHKIEPATGLIKDNGYEFIIIDSMHQIIAVEFYPLSESKISNLRNIR